MLQAEKWEGLVSEITCVYLEVVCSHPERPRMALYKLQCLHRCLFPSVLVDSSNLRMLAVLVVHVL